MLCNVEVWDVCIINGRSEYDSLNNEGELVAKRISQGDITATQLQQSSAPGMLQVVPSG